MEIWLDTSDTHAIAEANRVGVIYGVTTNPSILAQAVENHEKAINNLLDIQDGPLAVQVTATESEDMIKQALALQEYSSRIVVKVPVTRQGLVAMKTLSEKEIPVMATVVFEPRQALLAALAGAQYVAPYVGRIFDAGKDAYALLQSMMKIYQQHGFQTKILAAALRTPEQVVVCAEMGIKAVTLKNSLFLQFIEDEPLTMECLKKFSEDWGTRESSMQLPL